MGDLAQLVGQAFSHEVPLKTLVICCYHPRAAQVPQLVAERLDDIAPGEPLEDLADGKAAWRSNVFPIMVAGGRVLDALRSVAAEQPLFGIENIVVVHHSQCEAMRVDSGGLIDDLPAQQHVGSSLESDVALLHNHPAVPRSAAIFGYFFEIDSGALIEIVQARVGEK